MLECGHPDGCADEHGICQWCETIADLASIRSTNADLIKHLKKGANVVVVNGGSTSITTPEPIVLLEVYGGEVNLESPTIDVRGPEQGA